MMSKKEDTAVYIGTNVNAALHTCIAATSDATTDATTAAAAAAAAIRHVSSIGTTNTNMLNPFSLKKLQLGKSELQVTTIGVGTAGLSGLHGEMNETEAKDAISYAVECGVNFIDTAPYYNNRRAEILLQDIVSKLNREEICIATKVGRYMNIEESVERFDYSAAATRDSVYKSLECMNLSYIDVVQIHDVEFAPSLEVLVEETIPTLVDLKREGVIKAIGITGYSTRHVRRVAEECRDHIDVVMSYFRHNLFDTSLSADLPFYKNNNIAVINASPLAIGLLTNGGNVPVWNPATQDIKAACRDAAKFCDANNVDISRLAIRHSIEETDITMTLWSTRRTRNMRLNIVSALLPLFEEEKIIMEETIKGQFTAVKNTHWEEQLNEYHPFFKL